MDAKLHRHPNEHSWFIVSAAAGGATWAFVGIFTLGLGALIALPILGLLWLLGMVLRAQLLGNAVCIGPSQHPQIHSMVQELCAELEIQPPDVFLMSGSGMLNAFAVRFLGRGGSHVLLMAELVDLTLRRNQPDELRAILAHELAHHALGHVDPTKQALLLPSRFVAFLPQVYSRTCELSCDRVALALIKNVKTMQMALLALAGGSRMLADNANPAAFVEQSKRGGEFMNLLAIIQSTHPMLTTRVQQMEDYGRELGLAEAASPGG